MLDRYEVAEVSASKDRNRSSNSMSVREVERITGRDLKQLATGEAYISTQITNGAEARERLIAEETQTKSPHPSSYYFANMRSFGDPSSQRPNGFRDLEAAIEVKIVDESAVRGDES